MWKQTPPTNPSFTQITPPLRLYMRITLIYVCVWLQFDEMDALLKAREAGHNPMRIFNEILTRALMKMGYITNITHLYSIYI